MRHCEEQRDEAIQLRAAWWHGLLRSARNNGDTHAPAFSRRDASEFCCLRSALLIRAIATVRVEEDTGAVPRSDTGFIAFGRNGLSSSNGRLVGNRPFAHSDRFSGHKGAGKAGCRLHPWVPCKESTGVGPQVQPDQPAFPAQWFYGLFRALPGDRAFLPPSLANLRFNQLDASVGASGPRDFAVRTRRSSAQNCARRFASIASRAPRP